MKKYIIAIASWIIVAWAAYDFLSSLPHKISGHPDTQHIFTTIGGWIGEVTTPLLGDLFSRFGAYGVGTFELLSSIILLLPAFIWLLGAVGLTNIKGLRSRYHAWGGLLAAVVMAGAVFFHLATPLGVEVLHQGKSDGGSLFYSALSILILGIVLYLINVRLAR